MKASKHQGCDRQVSTGCCSNLFSDPFVMDVEKSRFAAQKSFFDESRARPTANPKLALQAQTVGSARVTPR
jgi:hypothetical protein